jgi:HEAT repeat protein
MPLIKASPPKQTFDNARSDLAAVHEAARDGDARKLAEILAADADALVREAALTSLARLGDAEAIAALIALIGSEDVPLRNAVIETLAFLGEPTLVALEPVLADADPNHRIYALGVLENAHHPRAAELALRVALRDPHVNVCAAAADVLANCGTSEMAAALQTVPARFPEHPFLRFAVRAALQKMGRPDDGVIG